VKTLTAVALFSGVVAFAQTPATPKPASAKTAIPNNAGPAATLSYKSLTFPPLRQPKIPTPDTFTLPNGMKVYLLEDHELPTISGFAMIRTGNLFDPPDKRGLADLTGSVLRAGGTKAKTGDQIDEQLENLAASVESNIGENRGTLSFSALKENTDEVLAVFKDFITNADFRQDKLDLAKTQATSGIARRNDDPGGIANREFQGILYGRNSPYGWSIEYEHINNIQRDDLVNFYKRYYFPANIRLSVYGDFDSAAMRAKLERLFADWTYKQPAVPDFPKFQGKPDAGVFVAEKSDVTQTFFEIGHTGGLLSDKDYPALQVTADILGSGFTSRLMRKVRTELGYAYSIGAGWGAGYLHPGLFEISGSTKSASTAETVEVIQQEVQKLRTGEVTSQELQTAKDTVLNGFVFLFDTPAKTLNRVVTYDYYGYPADFVFQYRKAIDSVTRADVLRVAKEYFKPENLTIVAVGNPKAFGRSLDTLKLPVKPIDLTIPEPKKAAAAADASTMARGKELLALAQKALGGLDKLAAVKDMSRTADASIDAGGQQMKAKQISRSVAPSTFRQDQELPFGKISVYSDGKTGWMSTPQGQQALPPPVLKQVQGEMFRELPTLLQSKNVNAAGPGLLDITDGQGNSTRLAIDEKTGVILTQTYQSVAMGGPPQTIVETYSDWRDVNGIRFPFKVVIEQGGKKFADVTVTDLKINSGIDAADLAKRP